MQVSQVTTCAACGYSVQRCKVRMQVKCCPDCKCNLKPWGTPVRQLTLPGLQRTLELEPLLRGELLAAMAAVVARPEVPAGNNLGAQIDSAEASEGAAFLWPQTGDPLVHYPLGGEGPRVEHPPGIVCNLCQWVTGPDGFPLPSLGREPRRFCAGCQRLIAPDRWVAYGSKREHCARCTARGIFAAVLGMFPHPPTEARPDETARKVKRKDVRRSP